MKLDWGKKITILYSAFVLFIIFMVYKASSFTVHLVTEDYYQEELAYQEHIEQLKNSNALKRPLQIDYQPRASVININYPMTGVQGKVKLYRPSNGRLDKDFEVETDEQNQQAISTAGLLSGLWKVQVKWQGDGQQFFSEQNVVIQ